MSGQAGRPSRFNLSALAVRERPAALFFLIMSIVAGTAAFLKLGRGTLVGTILTLVFLPALYALWFRIRPAADNGTASPSSQPACAA